MSFAYHNRTETGQLLSRAIQDVERVRFLTGRAAQGGLYRQLYERQFVEVEQFKSPPPH